MIRLFLKGIAYDINSNPIILLTDEEEEKVLPIWIGVLEAHTIAMAIENGTGRRPMIHDLVYSILSRLDVSVNSVVISDIKDNTFYSELHLDTPKGEMVLDSRPSDAIAMAMRYSAPVYLNRKLYSSMFKIKDLFDEDISEELEKVFNSEVFQKHKKTLH